MLGELAAVRVRVGHQPARELLLGQHRASGADVLEQLRHVLGRERADVDAVDRRHRRDVAGAEALERAHVDVRVPGRGAALIAS